jgi:hypothetical protein
LIIASGYGLVNTRFDPAFLKDNWREATAYIAQKEQPEDVVLLYNAHLQIPFDYSYPGNLPRQPIKLNLENLPIEPLTAGYQRSWVVYHYGRHPTHYPRQPIKANGHWHQDSVRNPLLAEWLEFHRDDVLDYQHFRGIELWLVEL